MPGDAAEIVAAARRLHLLTGMGGADDYFQLSFAAKAQSGAFSADYKDVYDAVIAGRGRFISLTVINPLTNTPWYATVDGRSRDMFIHLEEGQQPPTGAVVISSEERCLNCMIIKRSGGYSLYRAQPDFLP
jgi:hypothetical protein